VGRSGYPAIKQTQVVASLRPDQLEALERLEARRRRSAAQEARLGELWDLAFELHAERIEARKLELAAREERIRLYDRQGR
jgi:hypothetical protein